jgi:hypothetical protein
MCRRLRWQAGSHRFLQCLEEIDYFFATITARIGAGSPSIVLL